MAIGMIRTTNPIYGQQKWRVLALPSLALIILTFILVLKDEPSSPSDLLKLKWNSFQSSVQFQPTRDFMNGTDLIWQIPNSPKAVLFLAHGCHGRAANFWDKSPGCPNCVGLPEERLIVLNALDHKFAVLTVSSLGRCWTLGDERKTVKWIIEWWIKKNKLEGLPVTALGASSGGYLVSVIAADMRFSSITVMIAEGVYDMDIPKSYPPTLFVHMPKDHIRAKSLEKNMEILKQKGVDVKEIKCMEFPLTPYFLSDRIPGLDQTFSIKLFELFHEKGFIDEKGYMKNDGRATDWKQALKERKYLSEAYKLANHIEEELNLAFAYHEMTSLQLDDIFNWFESHMN